MDQLDTFRHRALERLAAHDHPGATCSLVDHGAAHGVGQVVCALGGTPGVDHPDPAGIAVDNLPPAEIDRVVGRQLAVDKRIGHPEAEDVVATVVLGLLLLYQVSLDRDP